MHSSDSFYKSSYSGRGDNCVEVRIHAEADVRDSKQPDAGHLTFPHQEWAAFLSAAGHGEL